MDIHTAGDLGLLIRERRKELGLDQATLASRVGVSRQWVIDVEKGRPRAQVGLILRTLRVLGLALRVEQSRAELSEDSPPSALVDIDAIVDRARERDEG